MSYPLIIFWLLVAYGMLSRGPTFLLYLTLAAGAFGAFAVIPTEAVGGITLTPAPMCAAFLLLKTSTQRGALAEQYAAAKDLRRFGFLTLFVVWAAASAYFLPRLFQGQVDIVPMRGLTYHAQPLAPANSNLTQPAYLMLSFASTLAYFSALRDAALRRHALYAILLAAIVAILTGVADLALQGTQLLAPFRTASYALLVDVEVMNIKRVVGLMPEASTYGGMCVNLAGALYFLRPAFPAGLRRRYVLGPTIAGLLIMAALSTSSSAYVGLAVLFLVAGLNWLRRATHGTIEDRSTLVMDLLALLAGALAFMIMLAARPELLDPIFQMVDRMVFQKSQSSSFAERSSWNQVGWESLIGTFGLGTGLGSHRASSWFVALLANTGLIGGLLMFAYLGRALLSAPGADPVGARMAAGAKLSIICSVILACLAGTSVDLGNSLLFAMIIRFSRPHMIRVNFGRPSASAGAPGKPPARSSP